MKILRFFLMASVGGLLHPAGAKAWDPYGHMLVDRIAYDLLDKKARSAVDELAGQVPFPGVTYTPVTMGCWMDDLREENPDNAFAGKFKPWHYIVWGHESSDAQPSLQADPSDTGIKNGNVIQGLKRSLAVLQGGKDAEIPDKAVALAILSHLAGDVHQPLHCASHFFEDEKGEKANDSGGNRVTIDNSPETTLPNGKTVRSNLHSFWDEAYRAVFDPGTGMLVTDQALKDYTKKDMKALDLMLAELAPRPPDPALSLDADFEAWGKESNSIAAMFAYEKLPRFKKNRYADVDEAYVTEARRIARERIVLAGYRLARLLNQTLGEKSL